MDLFVHLGEWIKRRFLPVPYDSSTHGAEAYYSSIYLELIRRELQSAGEAPLGILSAGCGTGRIAVPLASDGHRLTGIDHHRDSLRTVRRNTERAGVRIDLIDAEMLDAADALPVGSFDVVLAIESMYTHPRLPELVSRLADLLRPGGLFIGTHRTRFYYVMYCLANGRFEDALAVMNGNSGRLPKGPVRFFYNWQTGGELESFYRNAGLSIVGRHPIGTYSGFGPDPLAAVCDPSTLDPQQLATLRRIEMTVDPDTTMAARYVLVIARKDAITPT